MGICRLWKEPGTSIHETAWEGGSWGKRAGKGGAGAKQRLMGCRGEWESMNLWGEGVGGWGKKARKGGAGAKRRPMARRGKWGQ